MTSKKPVARLHNWYIEKTSYDTKVYIIRGNVTGHPRLRDTDFIRTTKILSTKIDLDTQEAILETKNTEYHCRLSECNYAKEETFDFLPKIKEYAKKYSKEKEYDVEDNAILLVLSDHERFYFDKALAKIDGVLHEGAMYPHIGMFQDSCIIYFSNRGIDGGGPQLRYFPHVAHLRSYAWDTEGLTVYLENAGENDIFYSTPYGVMRLEPNTRKKVCKENVLKEDEIPEMNTEDLYGWL